MRESVIIPPKHDSKRKEAIEVADWNTKRTKLGPERFLLPLTRAEVLLYLKRHGLTWRTDATNADPKFTRNWVRRDVLPRLEKRAPGVKERLAAMAAKVRAVTGRS